MGPRPDHSATQPGNSRLTPSLIAWLLGALALAMVAWDASALWRDATSWGGARDWLYFYFLAEVDRKTVLEFAQLPLWNPYYCGGAVHLANPQTYFLSPTFVFILAFGTPVGIRLTLTASLLLAFDGARRLGRTLGLDAAASLLAGGAFALSGTIHLHLAGGHVGWVGFAVLPYVLVALHRMMDPAVGNRALWLVGGAFALAWILGHFGVYPFPYSCICLVVYALLAGRAEAEPGRRWVRARAWLASALQLIALSVALLAVRVVPLVEFIRTHPRVVSDNTMVSPLDWWEILVVRHYDYVFPEHGWSWSEYGNYVGPFGAALLIAGAVRAWRSGGRWRAVATAAGLFLIFAMGSIPLFPWWWLKLLPVLHNMRVPERFIVLVSLFGSLLIGLCVHELARPAALAGALGRRARAIGLGALVVAAAFLVESTQFTRQEWRRTFGTPPPARVDGPDTGFRQRAGDKALMYAYPRSDRGTLDCFEESPLDISPRLRGDLPAEEYLADPDAGTVRRLRWSPNAIELDIEVSRATSVLVNQNFAPGWKASGGQIENHDGLLAARVVPGHHRVLLRYRPTSFLVGLAVSAASLLLCLVLVLRGRRRR